MRVFSIILFVVGVAVALFALGGEKPIPPFKIAAFEFDQLEPDGSAEAVFDLEPVNGFIRLSLVADLDVHNQAAEDKVSVTVKVSDTAGTLIAGTVSFNMEIVSANGRVSGSQNLEFEVQNSGPHALTVAFNDDRSTIAQRPNVNKLTASFVLHKYAENDNLYVVAAVLIVLGLYLFVRSFFRRPKKTAKVPNWGRGEPPE